MRFEEALKAMREGKKVVYREEIYFIGDEGDIRRYQIDDDGVLDTETSWYACLYGYDIMSEDWGILDE